MYLCSQIDKVMTREEAKRIALEEIDKDIEKNGEDALFCAAPMPGNILRVDVAQGDTVKAGQILIILEAMKMENEIVSPKDGTVAQVVTSKGAVVDTGAPLVIIA